jgi:hypothetical protein
MMLATFPMLMYIISLTLHKTMVMTVHNQYPDIELVPLLCFCNRGKYYKCLVERTDAGTMMKINFEFDPDQDDLGGILIYKMKRKRNAIFYYQSSIDITSANAIEDALEVMQLLITWKIVRFGEPKVNIVLIEYNNAPFLNEDEIAQLCNKVNDQFSSHNLSGWLVHDSEVLKVTYEVVQEAAPELKISISKRFRDSDAIRPMWIDSAR